MLKKALYGACLYTAAGVVYAHTAEAPLHIAKADNLASARMVLATYEPLERPPPPDATTLAYWKWMYKYNYLSDRVHGVLVKNPSDSRGGDFLWVTTTLAHAIEDLGVPIHHETPIKSTGRFQYRTVAQARAMSATLAPDAPFGFRMADLDTTGYDLKQQLDVRVISLPAPLSARAILTWPHYFAKNRELDIMKLIQ
jgi:hypothetical protein